MTDAKQLKRVRWGIRAVLILGVAASTTANVLHADDNPISQSIAAWPPLALLVTIEVVARVPIYQRGLALARLFATAVIAGIAAWVSYWHMAGVASRYGETGSSPYLLPLSVDGLIVVASICLVELGGRIRSATENGESNDQELPGTAGRAAAEDGRAVRPDVEDVDSVEAGDRQGDDRLQEGLAGREEVTTGVKLTPVRKRPPTSEAKVIRAHSRYPHESNAQLAERLNLSLVTVKRYRPKPADETPKNGHAVPHMVTVPNNEKEN